MWLIPVNVLRCTFVPSGTTCALLQIFGDMLSPLPTPDTVPMHPVRDILERCNKAGFIFKFETVLASDEGCTAQAAVVDDVVLGKWVTPPSSCLGRTQHCFLVYLHCPETQIRVKLVACMVSLINQGLSC